MFGIRMNDTGEEGVNVYEAYIDRLPGIHIQTDTPDGIGGRINLFKFSSLSVSNNYYTRNSNLGLLTVNSTWDGETKDSTFIFYPGEPTLYDEVTYLKNNQKFYQYCFNRTSQSTQPGPATDKTFVEGGGGGLSVAVPIANTVLQAAVRRGSDTDY